MCQSRSEICEIFKNTFFTEHFRATVSYFTYIVSEFRNFFMRKIQKILNLDLHEYELFFCFPKTRLFPIFMRNLFRFNDNHVYKTNQRPRGTDCAKNVLFIFKMLNQLNESNSNFPCVSKYS